MSLSITTSRLLGSYGAAYTIRKANPAAGGNAWTSGAETPAYVHCRGRERYAKPEAIRGGLTELQSTIVIDAATCPTEPKPGDRIALGAVSGDAGVTWRQIVNVYPAREGATVRVWRIEATK